MDPPRIPGSFADWARQWLSSPETELKDSSRVRYVNILNSYLLPAFGDLPPEAVTRERAAAFRQQLLQSGGRKGAGLAPKTVTDVLSVLKCVLRFAQDRGADAADLHGLVARQQRKPLRVFTQEEQRRLTAWLCEKPDLCRLGILLSLYTGIRIGELCALRWGDISLEDKSLTVRATLQRLQTFDEKQKTRIVITPPKSACSLRSIPLPDFLIEVLRPYRRSDGCYFLTGKPFFVEPRTLENRYKEALRACGIRDASFHTCRHSFATRCVELGFDVKSLSEILGHASVSITMNRYVHPSMDFKRRNMNKLSSLLE